MDEQLADFLENCREKTGANFGFDISKKYGPEVIELFRKTDPGMFILGLFDLGRSDFKIKGLSNNVLKVDTILKSNRELRNFSKALKMYNLKLGIKKVDKLGD